MTGWTNGRRIALGTLLVLSVPLFVTQADAARSRSEVQFGVRSSRGHSTAVQANTRALQAGVASYTRYGRGMSVARYGRAGGGLQCVPFARENSGIELSGNANTWWYGAAGVYERGSRPEVGSVLSFPANGRMRMGHVAVVARVVSGRTVQIDHANWSGPGGGRGRVSRNIDVVDVSPNNDWTAVRVALGQANTYGSVYPTDGFIYDRPDRGTMLANSGVAPAPMLALNAPPRDLRPAADRMLVSLAGEQYEEVAEAADDAAPRSRYTTRARSARHATSASQASVRTVGARTHGVSARAATGKAAHVTPASGKAVHKGRTHRGV